MNLAIIGCGHVATSYTSTLSNYPHLTLTGAYDANPERLAAFCGRWPVRRYASLEQLLDDSSVKMILNLTNPRNHFEVTRSCLEAGKHVYSEKPLAMDSCGAKDLVERGRSNNVHLASAPSSVLGETAQTIWKALKEGVVGRVRVVYANYDDGMIDKMKPWLWRNELGVPWPAKDEFEVGCTPEHAGYLLTWLAAFFGPAQFVTAFASCQISDKGIPVDVMAPDLSVACIEYPDGVVARVTVGRVAPRDTSFTIVGDEGVISTDNVRNEMSPVYIWTSSGRSRWTGVERRLNSCRVWLESRLNVVPWSGEEWRLRRKYPFVRKPPANVAYSRSKSVDFCRGPAELAEAIETNRSCRLRAELGLHITEIVETLQYPERFGWRRKIESSFPPMEPLPWET
jgi:predicted dehydrogenase